MMIVAVDNLNRETVADCLVASFIPDTEENKAKAADFCDWLNKFSCDGYGGKFHRVVENDYRLSRGMADLV